MHHAFEVGELDIARLLVARGASLDHIDFYGQTILHRMLATYSTSTPYHLFGDIEWRSRVGLSFLEFLAASYFENFAALDCSHSPPLNHFAWAGMHEIYFKLLQLGANAKMTGEAPKTSMGSLIHGAALGGSIAIIKSVVVENPRLNINLIDHWGRSPLHHALSSKPMNIDVVEYLLDQGADVDLQDKHGRTALQHAVCRSDHHYCLQPVLGTLLERGGSLRTRDRLGNTLLHHAARFGNVTCMRNLLEVGMDVNAQNIYHVTPLHCAAVLLGYLYRTDLIRETSEGLEQILASNVDLLLGWRADPSLSAALYTKMSGQESEPVISGTQSTGSQTGSHHPPGLTSPRRDLQTFVATPESALYLESCLSNHPLGYAWMRTGTYFGMPKNMSKVHAMAPSTWSLQLRMQT